MTARKTIKAGARKRPGPPLQDQLTARCSWCGNRDRGHHLLHRSAFLRRTKPCGDCVAFAAEIVAAAKRGAKPKVGRHDAHHA